MKQILLFTILLILIVGCSKENEDEPPVSLDDNLVEKIYEETGCYPRGVDSISDVKLFVDTVSSSRYLYGSKKMNNKPSFWVSKFTSSGDCTWDVVKSDGIHDSHAYNPVLLANGNILIANVKMENESLSIATIPEIILPSDSILKTVAVPEGYIYSDVVCFEKFFFCTISQQELDSNPNAIDYSTQISNDGELLKYGPELNIPEENDNIIWKNNDSFVVVDTSFVRKGNVLVNSGESWVYNLSLPEHDRCTIDVNFNLDSIIVDYALFVEGEERNLYYKLSYDNGTLLALDGKGNFPVEGISIEGIYLNNISESKFPCDYNNLELSQEDCLKMKISFTPSYAANKNLIWDSSDTNLATVDNDGVFTITSDMAKKGSVEITAKSEDGGYTATSKIDVDDVFFKAHGASWTQTGTSNTVSFISKITTSMNKNIFIGSVILVDENNNRIEVVSYETISGHSITFTSSPVVVTTSESLQSVVSKWKFIYTYRITGQTDYSTEEVNINAGLWSYNI